MKNADSTSVSETKLICIVEDDQDIQSVLQQILELEGYRVKAASNGQEALQLIDHGAAPADLILLDLMMPTMNGWEFLQAADSTLRERSIPVVIMTAGSFDPSKFPSTVTDKLKKPLDVDMLLKTISENVSDGRTAA